MNMIAFQVVSSCLKFKVPVKTQFILPTSRKEFTLLDITKPSDASYPKMVGSRWWSSLSRSVRPQKRSSLSSALRTFSQQRLQLQGRDRDPQVMWGLFLFYVKLRRTAGHWNSSEESTDSTPPSKHEVRLLPFFVLYSQFLTDKYSGNSSSHQEECERTWQRTWTAPQEREGARRARSYQGHVCVFFD